MGARVPTMQDCHEHIYLFADGLLDNVRGATGPSNCDNFPTPMTQTLAS